MVYEIVWTERAEESYISNLAYLQKDWTPSEVQKFILTVERKLDNLSKHPYIGSRQDARRAAVRNTIINKRISLVYRIRRRLHMVELILFWNTYQNPSRLRMDE